MRIIFAAVAMLGAVVHPMRCEPSRSRSCDEYVPALVEHAPPSGWNVDRMARIMWRESRCQPTAYNRRGQAAGLLQITPVSYPYLRDALGEWVDRWSLMDPDQNIRAASALFEYWSSAGRSGYQPWTT